MKTIFSDKATIVIRAMLAQPDKKWVARDFEKGFDVGRARAAAVLSLLRGKSAIIMSQKVDKSCVESLSGVK